MNISEKGKDLIKSFESLRLQYYHCPAGILTIGYGHTGGVKLGEIITEDEADSYLMRYLYSTENAINRMVRVPLTQNQYDALCSLVFNIGVGNFNKSTLLAKLNIKDYQGASEQFRVWNKIRQNGQLIISAGLINVGRKNRIYSMLAKLKLLYQFSPIILLILVIFAGYVAYQYREDAKLDSDKVTEQKSQIAQLEQQAIKTNKIVAENITTKQKLENESIKQQEQINELLKNNKCANELVP